MIVEHASRYGIPYVQLMFADSIDEVHSFLESHLIVRAFQCSEKIVQEFRRFAFYTKRFDTAVIDLGQDLQQIWGRFSKKSCRYEIKRADKMKHDIKVDLWDSDVYNFVNSFLRRKGLRTLRLTDFHRLRNKAHSFVVYSKGVMVCAHIVLVDFPKRARLLISATADRVDPDTRQLVSALNRKLHWYEIQFFKEKGHDMYDFGGVVLDRSSPLYSITRFKLSFGGKVVTEYDVWMSMNWLVRSSGRLFSKVRVLWK